jgi:hypothetical protein
MSTHVVTGFKAQAGRADEVVAILGHVLLKASSTTAAR